MYLTKTILISFLSSILVLLNEKPNNRVFLSYNFDEEPEILKGHVKELIEIRSEAHTEDELCPIDTIFIDKNGLPVETRLGTGDKVCIVTNYTKQYHDGLTLESSNGDKAENQLFKYGKNGQIIESVIGGDSTLYTYGSTGYLTISYSYLNGKMYKKTDYKYDTKNNVILKDNQFHLKKRVVFESEYRKILSVDKKGNWTKRIIYLKNSNGIVHSADTTIRKITYYK